MEDRETARMRKYGESKTTRIMMATVLHVISVFGTYKISGRWIFVDTSVQCDIGVLSRNQCCRGKEISIKHSELVTEALVNQHAKRMRRMTSSVACLALPYIFGLSHKRHDFRGKKMLLNIKYILIFAEIWSGIFLMLRRISREVTINMQRSLCKYPLFLPDFDRT